MEVDRDRTADGGHAGAIQQQHAALFFRGFIVFQYGR
jgi:hypothetical protein